jgi:hypothetical protein
MPRFKIAHIKVQDADLIIVPLESSFGHKTQEDQQQAIAELQIHANAADLKGDVVPVWDSGGGRMAFIAPTNWHPYFKSISLAIVWACVNRELYW